ncbi:MAG: nuclear transport factor 2 family protein [Chloroflexi bacterium]|nr:nuclear transport factor 2 family protein [Chloroflexota bacterium]
MDNDTMERALRDLYASGDVQELARRIPDMASEDMVQEWPQSEERIRGRDNVMAVNENYPAATGSAPKLTLRRIVRPGEAWVAEATIDYGDGTPVSLVSILETGPDGKIARQTDYFASPFEAPEWRRQWVEKMEPVAAD